MSMHFSINLEWWQLVIASLYLLVGGLFWVIGWFTSGIGQSMGSAFGYPSSRWRIEHSLVALFLWPVVLVILGFGLTYECAKRKP